MSRPLEAVCPSHTVLLRHELPDGSWHIDWMIDVDQRADARLMTFRAARRIDELGAGERLDLDRLADHRRAWLEHEGPVSGERGHVRRLASGRIDAMQNLGERWAFAVVWRVEGNPVGHHQHLILTSGPAGRWVVEAREPR